MPSGNTSQDGRNGIAGGMGLSAAKDVIALTPYIGTVSVTGSQAIASTTHGFTTPSYCIVIPLSTSAPSSTIATYSISGGTVTAWLWKRTSAADTTLVADTVAKTCTVIIWGT